MGTNQSFPNRWLVRHASNNVRSRAAITRLIKLNFDDFIQEHDMENSDQCALIDWLRFDWNWSRKSAVKSVTGSSDVKNDEFSPPLISQPIKLNFDDFIQEHDMENWQQGDAAMKNGTNWLESDESEAKENQGPTLKISHPLNRVGRGRRRGDPPSPVGRRWEKGRWEKKSPVKSEPEFVQLKWGGRRHWRRGRHGPWENRNQ